MLDKMEGRVKALRDTNITHIANRSTHRPQNGLKAFDSKPPKVL